MEQILQQILNELKDLKTDVTDLKQGLARLEHRQDRLEQGLARLEQRQDRLEQGLARLEQRQDRLEQGLANLEQEYVRTNQWLECIFKETAGLMEFRTEIKERIDSLEIITIQNLKDITYLKAAK